MECFYIVYFGNLVLIWYYLLLRLCSMHLEWMIKSSSSVFPKCSSVLENLPNSILLWGQIQKILRLWSQELRNGFWHLGGRSASGPPSLLLNVSSIKTTLFFCFFDINSSSKFLIYDSVLVITKFTLNANNLMTFLLFF